MTVSVVVPVKDEAENVASLAREIARALIAEPDHEIIFVDDGSSDGTPDRLSALKNEIPGFRPLRHDRNLGQSRAIRTGVLAARGGIIVTLDGDGQNDPADIPALLKTLRADPSLGLVSGVRVKRQDSASRRIASRLGNGIRQAILKDGASDTGCGLKAFHRDAFLELPYFDHIHRYLIALVQREGWKVAFVPVNHRPRQAGRSKYTNLGRTLVSVNDMLGVRWLQRRHGGRTKVEALTMFYGYLAHLFAAAAAHPYDVAWNAIGFGGQAIFGVRFLIQWFRSEQEGHSVIPITFWYCSFVGALFSLAYAVHQQAWALVLGQGLPLPIYARNIWMIYRDRMRSSAAA